MIVGNEVFLLYLIRVHICVMSWFMYCTKGSSSDLIFICCTIVMFLICSCFFYADDDLSPLAVFDYKISKKLLYHLLFLYVDWFFVCLFFTLLNLFSSLGFSPYCFILELTKCGIKDNLTLISSAS